MTRRRILAFLAAAAALAAWHLALRASQLRLPLIVDEGEYAYAARVWAAGGLPYRDASSQKPPTILWVYRAGLALGGPERGPRALGVLASLLTAALLCAAAPREWAAAARAAPAAAYAALSTLPVGDYGLPANTETFVCLFTAAAAAALARAWRARGRGAALWAAGAGMACGAAVATKQTAVFTALGFLALAAWEGEGRFSLRRAAAFALGAAAAPLAWLGYFAARGAAGPLLDQALRGNLSYASVVGVSGLAEQGRWLAARLVPGLLRGAWPALLLAAVGLAARPASWREREAALAALWLGAALAGVMTGLLFFPHYFLQAAAPLSLCAAFGAQRMTRPLRPAAGWAAAGALALLPGFCFASSYLERDAGALARRLLWPNPLLEARALGRDLAARTKEGETIYVFGSEPEIYVYAGRRAAAPLTSVYMLTLRRPRPGQVDEELARLRAARPSYVVYSRQPLSALIAHSEGLRFRDGVRRWLVADYRLIEDYRVGQGPRPAAGAPDFSAADSLLLFERRPLQGGDAALY